MNISKNTNQIYILLANQTDTRRMEVSIDDAKEFANTKRIEFYQVSPKDESFPSLIKSLGERIYARIEKSDISLKPGYGIMQTDENKDKPKRDK